MQFHVRFKDPFTLGVSTNATSKAAMTLNEFLTHQAGHSKMGPLISMGVVSLASLQYCLSIEVDTQCKRALAWLTIFH